MTENSWTWDAGVELGGKFRIVDWKINGGYHSGSDSTEKKVKVVYLTGGLEIKQRGKGT
jgi:hypothetical protein